MAGSFRNFLLKSIFTEFSSWMVWGGECKKVTLSPSGLLCVCAENMNSHQWKFPHTPALLLLLIMAEMSIESFSKHKASLMVTDTKQRTIHWPLGRKIITADPRTQEAKATQDHVGPCRGWDNSRRCLSLSLDYKAVCTGKYMSQLFKDDVPHLQWFWTNVCMRPFLCLIVMTSIHPTDWR